MFGPFTETIAAGAFRKTLSDGADVAFLLNHTGMTLARTKPGTLKLSEVTEPMSSPVLGVTGLHSEALLDPKNPQVQAMRSAVERSDLDEMSFAFRVVRERWSEAYDQRVIQEVNMQNGDVSLVNFGASPWTGGTVDLRQRLQRPPGLVTPQRNSIVDEQAVLADVARWRRELDRDRLAVEALRHYRHRAA